MMEKTRGNQNHLQLGVIAREVPPPAANMAASETQNIAKHNFVKICD